MFADIASLEERLSRPTPDVIDTMRRLDGDVLVLGVGGKIGPSLTRMIRRANDEAGTARRIVGVARFSTPELAEQLEADGIETIRCDLLDRAALEKLPKIENVFYLPAQKFGSTGQEARTWAMNTYLAGMVCEAFPNSRIVAYSTGNVYPLVPATGDGATEQTPLGPIGEYAMSCMGRERMFSYFSEQSGLSCAILRLNYATEMRYGVLVDIAQKVLVGQPIDLAMGYFNAIWQGDSNAMTIRALDHVACPPAAINLAGADRLSVRTCAEQLGRLMNKPVEFERTEAPDALLSNGQRGHELLGRPTVDAEEMMRWIADWLVRGGETLSKPTHFQTRDGKF